MPKTRDQLIARAAKHLGVLASGQTLSAEDQSAIEDGIDPCLAQLAAEDVVYVGDDGAIPDEWFNLVASVLAFDLRMDFGKTGEEAIALERNARTAKDALRMMRRGRPTGEAQPTDYGREAECNDTGYR
jgi:hypothetical protein